ncbi:hypothetical protein Csa_012035 [Cucumis sativus]|uniref:Uncharacterized protein n=1 Tax=Cucumis sativus TaxID=3659 RepID=A0A0A0L158_CUCSA|nr:hypothetical protein Csa_012035 [Cucumis sativus]
MEINSKDSSIHVLRCPQDGSKNAIPCRPPNKQKQSLNKAKVVKFQVTSSLCNTKERIFYAGTSTFGISPPPSSIPLPTFVMKTGLFRSTIDGSTQNSRTHM